MWSQGKGEFAVSSRCGPLAARRHPGLYPFSGGQPVGRSCWKWTARCVHGPEPSSFLLSCVLRALTQRKEAGVLNFR
jgi:hypothetical protein